MMLFQASFLDKRDVEAIAASIFLGIGLVGKKPKIVWKFGE